ncbi:MCE family protein [Gordonia sp. NPDC003429]
MSVGNSSIRKPLIGFALFTVVALLLTYIIYSTLERSVPGKTHGYTTYFTDASGLHTGDDVRMAGVRVGRVSSIDLDSGRARVVFDVSDSQPMLTTTKASIRYQNLIGQRYLELSLQPGAEGAPLPAGSTLKVPAEDSFDVTKLLAGFQPVFDTLKPEQVNSLSNGLLQAFQGNSVSLSTTVAEVGRLAADMSDRDAVIGAIINNLSGVMRDLALQGDQVGTVIASVSTLIENLNANSAAFGRAVTQVGQTAAGFADVLTRSRTDLVAASNNTQVATNELIANGAKLDQTARILPGFLALLPKTMQDGAYLNIYFCDLDISFGNVLFPPGLINKIGGTRFSDVCR